MADSYNIKINTTNEIKSNESVTLLGVEVDNRINFENHIGNLCKKAGAQIHAIGRLQRFLGFKGKKY